MVVYRDQVNTLRAEIKNLSDGSAYPDGAKTVSVEFVLSDGTSLISEDQELTVASGYISLPLTKIESTQTVDKGFISILADDIEPIEFEVSFADLLLNAGVSNAVSIGVAV